MQCAGVGFTRAINKSVSYIMPAQWQVLSTWCVRSREFLYYFVNKQLQRTLSGAWSSSCAHSASPVDGERRPFDRRAVFQADRVPLAQQDQSVCLNGFPAQHRAIACSKWTCFYCEAAPSQALEGEDAAFRILETTFTT